VFGLSGFTTVIAWPHNDQGLPKYGN